MKGSGKTTSKYLFLRNRNQIRMWSRSTVSYCDKPRADKKPSVYGVCLKGRETQKPGAGLSIRKLAEMYLADPVRAVQSTCPFRQLR